MIALVGSGEYLPEMDAVDRYLLDRLGPGPRVACLPTAAGTEGAERIDYWSRLGVEHFTRLGARPSTVPVVTREDALDTALANDVRQADFVYLSGGKPDYLLATLKDSPVWDAISEVHARRGVVAGCSAGAMVLGGFIPGLPRLQPAFSLLPGSVVVPHFDEVPGWMLAGIRLWVGPSRRLVGVPGFTALFVENGECRVLGRGPVTLSGWGGRRSLESGEAFNWTE
jgi:cyanophycinase